MNAIDRPNEKRKLLENRGVTSWEKSASGLLFVFYCLLTMSLTWLFMEYFKTEHLFSMKEAVLSAMDSSATMSFEDINSVTDIGTWIYDSVLPHFDEGYISLYNEIVASRISVSQAYLRRRPDKNYGLFQGVLSYTDVPRSVMADITTASPDYITPVAYYGDTEVEATSTDDTLRQIILRPRQSTTNYDEYSKAYESGWFGLPTRNLKIEYVTWNANLESFMYVILNFEGEFYGGVTKKRTAWGLPAITELGSSSNLSMLLSLIFYGIGILIYWEIERRSFWEYVTSSPSYGDYDGNGKALWNGVVTYLKFRLLNYFTFALTLTIIALFIVISVSMQQVTIPTKDSLLTIDAAWVGSFFDSISLLKSLCQASQILCAFTLTCIVLLAIKCLSVFHPDFSLVMRTFSAAQPNLEGFALNIIVCITPLVLSGAILLTDGVFDDMAFELAHSNFLEALQTIYCYLNDPSDFDSIQGSVYGAFTLIVFTSGFLLFLFVIIPVFISIIIQAHSNESKKMNTEKTKSWLFRNAQRVITLLCFWTNDNSDPQSGRIIPPSAEEQAEAAEKRSSRKTFGPVFYFITGIFFAVGSILIMVSSLYLLDNERQYSMASLWTKDTLDTTYYSLSPYVGDFPQDVDIWKSYASRSASFTRRRLEQSASPSTLETGDHQHSNCDNLPQYLDTSKTKNSKSRAKSSKFTSFSPTSKSEQVDEKKNLKWRKHKRVSKVSQKNKLKSKSNILSTKKKMSSLNTLKNRQSTSEKDDRKRNNNNVLKTEIQNKEHVKLSSTQSEAVDNSTSLDDQTTKKQIQSLGHKEHHVRRRLTLTAPSARTNPHTTSVCIPFLTYRTDLSAVVVVDPVQTQLDSVQTLGGVVDWLRQVLASRILIGAAFPHARDAFMTNPAAVISIRRTLFGELTSSSFSQLTPYRRAARTTEVNLGSSALISLLDTYPYGRYLNTTAQAACSYTDDEMEEINIDSSTFSALETLDLQLTADLVRADLDDLLDRGLVDLQASQISVQWVTFQGDSFTLIHNEVLVDVMPSGELKASIVTSTESIPGETTIESTAPTSDSSTPTEVSSSTSSSLSLSPTTIKQITEGVFIASVVFLAFFVALEVFGIQTGLLIIDVWLLIDVAIAVTLCIATFLFVVAFQNSIEEGWLNNEYPQKDPPGSSVLDVLRGPDKWYSFTIGSVSSQPHGDALAGDRATRIIGAMSEFANAKINQSRCLCVLIVLLTVRMAKFVDIIPSYGYVAKIIRKSMMAVCIVGLILGLVFIECVALGLITLGAHISEFSTLTNSFITLFNVVSVFELWDDDDASYLYSDYMPWMSFFRLVFSFAFVFVANNLIVAIIVEAALNEHVKTLARAKALEEGYAAPVDVNETDEEAFERELAGIGESLCDLCRASKTALTSSSAKKNEDDDLDFYDEDEDEDDSMSLGETLIDSEHGVDHKAIKDNHGRRLMLESLKHSENNAKARANAAALEAETQVDAAGIKKEGGTRMRSIALSQGGLDGLKNIEELVMLADEDERVGTGLAIPHFEVGTEDVLMFKAFVSRIHTVARDSRDSLRVESKSLWLFFEEGESVGGLRNEGILEDVKEVAEAIARSFWNCLDCFFGTGAVPNLKKDHEAEMNKLSKAFGVDKEDLVLSSPLQPWTLNDPIVTPSRLRLVQQMITDLILLHSRLFRLRQELLLGKDAAVKAKEIAKNQIQIANALEVKLRTMIKRNVTLEAGSDLAKEYQALFYDRAKDTSSKLSFEVLSKDILKEVKGKSLEHSKKVKEWRRKEGIEDPFDLGPIDPLTGLPIYDLNAAEEILKLKNGLPVQQPGVADQDDPNPMSDDEIDSKMEGSTKADVKKEEWQLTIAQDDVKESRKLERRLKKAYLLLEQQQAEPSDWNTLRTKKGGERRPSFLINDGRDIRLESGFRDKDEDIPGMEIRQPKKMDDDSDSNGFSKFKELLDPSDRSSEVAEAEVKDVLNDIFNQEEEETEDATEDDEFDEVQEEEEKNNEDDEEDEEEEEEDAEFVFKSSKDQGKKKSGWF